MNFRHLLLTILLLTAGRVGFASHIMGGEVTWTCLGSGQFQFELILYRDCNGLEIIDNSLNLEVWGHPSVTSIQCNLITTIDLSPNCTEVAGGPPELDCGSGTGGGNGPGAIQKFIYRSNPITLSGTPPAGGWAFTYDSFSRNWSLSNIDQPQNYGITLSAIMYPINGGSNNPCSDSSPQFAQEPYLLLCEGTDFAYDANTFDPDNDSLVFSWGQPLDHFPAGTFNPPTNPAPVPFDAGFAYNNPTPDQSFNPSNIPANMNSQTGEITFRSYTTGNFGMVQKIDSYRNGQLIATVFREIQMVVIDCPGYNNTPPSITPPFDGNTSFDTTIFAGDLINFDIVIDDPELLQDGSPQVVTLTPSGNYFGANFTDPNSGCEYTPCATLDQAPVIAGVQGVTVNFDWQTTCDHLLDANGIQQAEQTYTFVLNAQDDYCQVPGRTYQTIRITLKNKPDLDAPDLHCVDVLANGDVELTWTPVTDIGSSFQEYEVWSIEDGLIATIPTVATSNYTVPGANADLGSKNYFIKTIYGCDGNNESSSDTLTTIFLNLTDLADGRVLLEWNNTHSPINNGESIQQGLYREYPAGVWTLRKSVDYGVNSIIDTIDICDATLAWEIRVENSAGCTSTSNEPGGQFQDIINPHIPDMYWVTVDTTNDLTNLSWNQNPSPDTHGYIIYTLQGGFWVPIDTVYGIGSTTYTDSNTFAHVEAQTYRIAAFDSCWTNSNPATYQTSALSDLHTTIFTTNTYDICDKSIELDWSDYVGWPEGIKNYEVIVSIGGSTFEVIETLDGSATSYTHTNLIYDVEYQYFIRAISQDDSISYSNRLIQYTEKPSAASYHYLATASHNLSDGIEVICFTDPNAAVQYYEVEAKGPYDNQFNYLATIQPNGTSFISYTDYDIYPNRGAYEYRVNLVDTCGVTGNVSNIGRTIFLEVHTDDVQMLNTLSWSPYYGFDGDIIEYRIYRGVNGVFESTPIGTTIPEVRSFVDDVTGFMESEGQFCYRVEAVEDTNSYNLAETSFSNTACAVVAPVVYIPNAFMVNGVNNIFIPVISLYDFSSYDLGIYDRWGSTIFVTNDRDQGWDGTNASGDLVSEGTYVYYLRFTDRDGVLYEYRGFVTMLIADN